MMQETKTEERGEQRIVILLRGMMERGGFYWCYLAVKPELIKQFQAAVAEKYNIQNFVADGYGEVIVSGRGRNPPDEITAYLVKSLGTNFESLDGGDAKASLERIVAMISQSAANKL